MSCQRILANHNNLIPSATLAASSVAEALRQVFRQPTTRAGNGQIVLSGGYTGANDATFDIQILSASGTAARVSKPIFAGAGNGTMTQPTAADGTESQEVTVALADLGTTTTAATLTLYGDIYLQAKPDGADGNALTITVTPVLTLGAVVGALSFDLKADTQEWTDAGGNFGAVPLSADGTLPDTCPRLVFGGDTAQVYRHYKRWDGTQWQYGVSPKLKSDFAAGSTVTAVTGTYSVTITDGVTPETYASITTLYDLLLALNASDLARPLGTIANDRKPNGIGAVDLPIRTTAFARPVIASAPDRMPTLQGLVVADTAPTETITVTCKSNTPIGAETWGVSSGVQAALPDAITGAAYAGYAAAQFTIPAVPLDTEPVTGTMAITATNFQNAGTAVGVPAVCLDRPRLGAKASNMTLELVWTPRPADDCDCKDASVSGGPNPDCLGIDISGGTDVTAIPSWYQTRLVTLHTWAETFARGNTALSDALATAAAYDLALADLIVKYFGDTLATLYANFPDETPATATAAALTLFDTKLSTAQSDVSALNSLSSGGSYTAWAANTAYSAGDTAVPSPQRSNGHYYKMATALPAETLVGTCTKTYTGFKSGSTEPTWSVGGGSATEKGLALYHLECADSSTSDGSEEYTLTWIDAGMATGDDIGLNVDGTAYGHSVQMFAKRYEKASNVILATAGIVPKTDAGGDGSACWQQSEDDHYWAIRGTGYLPVFNNVYYHSVKRAYNPDAARYEIVSTHEFGFGLQISCADRLVDGDTITISIGDVSSNYPYSIGDSYKIPLIAGGPLSFAGGIDGTDTQTWTVQSSTAGLLDDYSLNSAEDAYSDGGLGFTINRGGIPFALGDAFAFSVESGGRFQWRKDGGSWSTAVEIADSAELTDGLTAAFVSGAAPSFVADDTHTFTVRQPHSPSHVQSAHGETWQWTGATATLTASWATDQTINAVGLLRHGLSGAATASIALKDSGGTTLHTFAPTVTTGPLLEFLEPLLETVRSVVVTIANATGMNLGWLYAGTPYSSTYNADQCSIQRAYKLESGSGVNPRGLYLGAGKGGEIAWNNFLWQTDLDPLLALIDACKQDSDAPVVVVPQALFPEDAFLARINSEALEIPDWNEYQPNDKARRALSVRLPLEAVIT